jgi:hypothetical protein
MSGMWAVSHQLTETSESKSRRSNVRREAEKHAISCQDTAQGNDEACPGSGQWASGQATMGSGGEPRFLQRFMAQVTWVKEPKRQSEADDEQLSHVT